jgi:hypothetical protein
MKIRIQVIVVYGLCLSALACFLLAVHFLSLVTTLYSIATPEFPEEMIAWWNAVQYYAYSVGTFLVTCILMFFVAFPRFRNKRSLAKMLLVVSGSFLNAFFMWSAHVLTGEAGVSLSMLALVVISDATSLGMPYPQDYICLGLFLTTIAAAFFLGMPRGMKLAVARATQAGSLVMMPLGIEVYLFDRSEYNLHFSMALQSYGLTWFTNADLLYLSAVVFVGTTALLFLSRQHHRIPQITLTTDNPC